MNKETFFNLLFSSIKMTNDNHSNIIFYCYNKNIERQLKYKKLFNLNNPINYIFNNDDVLFEQDIKYKKLWINYDKIWTKLESKYNNLNTYELIDKWLKDESYWKQYISSISFSVDYLLLKNDTNWKQYTSITNFNFNTIMLKNDTNWKNYTPMVGDVFKVSAVEK